MEKVFVLCRMWDKTPRGHETVERISTDIEPILEYIKKFSYVGGEKTQKIEMDESFNMSGICKKLGEESIKYYFNNFRKSICQHFIKVTGHKFDDPEEDEEYTMYRLQVRNIHLYEMERNSRKGRYTCLRPFMRERHQVINLYVVML